ncbi:hypothetical protein B0H16DRAFT_1879339 [Mycena metata]|uniref:Chromo domain-containing protein n=1 Tax=Mycena metata TaxID=1033252 RepID=A0AAD7K525_9AGAR|nr:hypothetical protein B0H16DRAFT_1879339 [Mycena metata]
MAPAVSPTPSNNDDGKKKKKSPTKSKKVESEVEDSEGQSGEDGGEGGEEGGGDDDEEGEYEIEAILDAKKGYFPKNKTGYLVKWKGYDESHNSWVAEDDAGGAGELIDEFEAKLKKKKQQQSAKKASVPQSPAAKRSRKSMADAESEDGEASASVAKKRGRKSVSEKPADKDDDDERPVKKARKSTSGKNAPVVPTAEPLPDDDKIGNMQQHMQAPTWDQLIKHIDTVERVDKTLYVYFTLNDGERIREDSKICADKFPKMLIEFYESNLRWKEADSH